MNVVPIHEPQPRARVPGDNIVTIASGKGGVGKTWLATSLSHALARAGKRCLLFDGDLGLANVDVQLGLRVERDLTAVVSGRRQLGRIITTYGAGGFDIIAGRSGSGGLNSLIPSTLGKLRSDLIALSSDYDVVIADLGAGVAPAVRELVINCGACIVVATADPTSLTDAYAFIKLTALDRPETNIRVVINLAKDLAEGEATYATLHQACENFLKFSPPLAGIIRQDQHVTDSIRHQVATYTRYPNCTAMADVEAIATHLRSSET